MSDQNQSVLDSRQQITQIDKSNMLGSIEELGLQIKHAWADTRNLSLILNPPIKNVIIAGMGGSGLGGDVIKSLFKQEMTVPLDLVHDYTLPNFVNQSTLVILSSYSGTTEEILACAEDARQRQAQIAVICAGGDLADFAKKYDYPVYVINALHNPSNQPRMAIGYAVFGTIAILEKAGIIKLYDQQVDAVVNTITAQIKACTVEIEQSENPAKALAYTMIDRRPVLVVSEFLEGAAHVTANQLNENGKVFVDYKVVPEMDHHLLEGLKFPKSNSSTHVFIFVETLLLRMENILRIQLSRQIVADNEIDTIAVPLKSSSKLEQVFEMITMFSFAGFYLAMLEGVDPSPIPFVDNFKNELSKKRAQMNQS
jgi:glucose/mannose-6-phosphate isomerase